MDANDGPPFKVGGFVRLKRGGPKMLIIDVGVEPGNLAVPLGTVDCEWTDETGRFWSKAVAISVIEPA
jgi:uncharacterized protein YodC (DUF2158 family)